MRTSRGPSRARSAYDLFTRLMSVLIAVCLPCSVAWGEDHADEYVPKFEMDVQPILTARGCNSGPCHGKARGQNGFELSLFGFDDDMDYGSIVKNARGRRLQASAPKESLLLTKAIGKEPHGGGIRLVEGDPDYETIVAWIQGGMQRASDADPKLTKIEFHPESTNLAPGERLGLKVIATDSTGLTKDVTRVSAFQSSDTGIVKVDPDGIVLAGEHVGEATIMARYMGQIATWSTAVLKPRVIDPEIYASLPKNNPIDVHVLNKLQALDVRPSEPAEDTTYLRRLMLDAIGRLPTPEEVEEYLNDTQADRRSRWIDYALDQPEYADYWANKWADLLRPNPYRVGIKATYSLDLWLRESFRKNLPYDAFVRELLTAQGSTWRNGATTFYRDRREPDEITSVVSQLFLGVRLECAKCHQHPFEIYGQGDFYGMASFFAKVGQKGVGLSPPISGGEEVFFVRSTGAVHHPLTKQELAPKPLLEESIELNQGDDPRVALADWLVGPDNRYFAKAAVNRLWGEVMGIGIVDPIDDFRATNPPSNPELLEYLADYFIEVGFDNKKLLKEIFSSQVYGFSSVPNESNVLDYRNFARHYRRRMRAEVLADAISDATGVPTTFHGVPHGTRATQLWTYRVDSELLDAFSRPDANQDPPCERIADTTMSQSLHLMNSVQMQQRLTSEEGSCAAWAKEADFKEIVRRIYLQIYSRLPDQAEIDALLAERAKQPDHRLWVEDIVWSMINSPEFSFVD